MTDNDRKYAIECIDYQLENGYLDLGCHDKDELEVVREAMFALKVLEQIRWERDVAISQLEELGLSLGQKVDHVKETINKATPIKLKEVKGMYDITKPVCPRCGDDLFGEYCSECGQKLIQE